MIDDERIFLRTSPSNIVPHAFPYAYALPLVQGMSVIDLCCGTGYGTRLLSEAAGDVLGVDYSKDAIDYCNTRPLPNVRYELADIEDYNIEGFGAVTCMQGLEHLDNPKKLIQANLDKLWVFALPNDQGDSNPHHHHKITPELIKDWFGETVIIKPFDDTINWRSTGEHFSNYLGIYRP